MFQSARPARGATCLSALSLSYQTPRGFNPHAPRGARPADLLSAVEPDTVPVSIRTPREGRDVIPYKCTRTIRTNTRFNPHAPRGARPGTLPDVSGRDKYNRFQSARPARGATLPMSPRGHTSAFGFQSARPARGATRTEANKDGYEPTGLVSIRTPREGRDLDMPVYLSLHPFTVSFNPHAPRGARPQLLVTTTVRLTIWQFQSARPARGATSNSEPASLWRGDVTFQSARPARGADVTMLAV